MLYGLIRLVIIAIIGIILLLVIIKCGLVSRTITVTNSAFGPVENKRKLTKKSKLVICIYIVIIVAVVALLSYPYEGAFLRFTTLDNSLSYSIYNINSQDKYILENEKCYFLFFEKNNNVQYHSVSKYDNGMGLVDYDTTRRFCGTQSVEISGDVTIASGYVIYNHYADCTCYYVTYFMPNGTTEDNVIKINGKTAECLTYFENSSANYALIQDGTTTERVTVEINKAELVL